MTSVSELRRRASAILFKAEGVKDALDRLSFVQADPLRFPAPAQDLILRQRVSGYHQGDLEDQYTNIGADEEFLHVYGFTSRRLRDLLHPRLHATPWDPEEGLEDSARKVLALIRAGGAHSLRDIEREVEASTVLGPWGRPARSTTRDVRHLHRRGLVRVAGRKGNGKTYEAVPLTANPSPPAERARAIALALTRLYAPVTVSTWRSIINLARYDAPALKQLAPLEALLAEGLLVEDNVDGMRYVSPADQPPGVESGGVRLLAPFDPLVWDRPRFQHLHGWEYKFEAYTPAAKRQWGHYALPLLWQDEVIGWANLNYKAGDLQADLGFVRSRPRSRAFTVALDEELDDIRQFLQPR